MIEFFSESKSTYLKASEKSKLALGAKAECVAKDIGDLEMMLCTYK